MVSDYGRTKSRLARRHSRAFLRQAIGLVFLSFAILYLLIRFGIPVLIKLAGFIGDLRGRGNTPQEEEQSVLVAPTLQPLPEATFSAEITVSGFAQEGVTVVLVLNGDDEDETSVDTEGQFTFEGIDLRKGDNTLWAVARDDKDNESPQSSAYTVVVDQENPSLTIDSPQDGSTHSDKTVEVRGIASEEASITVNGQFARQGSDGSFMKLLNLNEGTNTIEVVAIDLAGNKVSKTVIVTYSP